MAVHLIIDGYNLIGSEKGLRGNLQDQRNQLIRQLQRYRERKSYPITVVFDGWRSGWVHEVEEKVGGITVVYSQQGEKADSVIQRLAREIGSGCVVTSDREVQRTVEASGAVAIYSSEFSAKLRALEGGFADYEEGELDESVAPRKRGNPRRLSRRERKRQDRLRKL